MRQLLPQLWLEILEEIGDQAGQDVYLRQAVPFSLSTDALNLEVPSLYTQDRIEGRYGPEIRRALASRMGEQCQLIFTINETAQAEISEATSEGTAANAYPNEETGLNPKYLFERFIVGSSNRICHAAALRVSENPGQDYNPLFIYGGVGLGKTHLLHAIGNRLQVTQPQKKVLYVTSETFMNEYVESIANRATAQGFRAKYRTVDMLLIDDIQFLQRKEGTQEEFFNTFNHLHLNSNQIVMSSDRPPATLRTLEERLKSRFEWGMVAEIDRPQYEMRIAILRQKCEDQGLDNLNDDVLSYIAEVVSTNIRELEGTLTRLMAQASILKEDLNLDFARRVLNDVSSHDISLQRRTATPQGIQKAVADYFRLEPDDLISHKRTKALVLPRQIAMYLCRELTQMSLTDIATVFNRQNHTTVLHACTRIEDSSQDEELKRILDELRDQFR